MRTLLRQKGDLEARIVTTCGPVQNKTGDFEKVRQNTKRRCNARNEVGTRHLKEFL